MQSQFLPKNAKKLIWNLALPAWVPNEPGHGRTSVTHSLVQRNAEEGGQVIRCHLPPEDVTTTAVQALFRHQHISLGSGKTVAGRQLPHNYFFPFILSMSDAAHSQTRYLPFEKATQWMSVYHLYKSAWTVFILWSRICKPVTSCGVTEGTASHAAGIQHLFHQSNTRKQIWTMHAHLKETLQSSEVSFFSEQQFRIPATTEPQTIIPISTGLSKKTYIKCWFSLGFRPLTCFHTSLIHLLFQLFASSTW